MWSCQDFWHNTLKYTRFWWNPAVSHLPTSFLYSSFLFPYTFSVRFIASHLKLTSISLPSYELAVLVQNTFRWAFLSSLSLPFHPSFSSHPLSLMLFFPLVYFSSPFLKRGTTRHGGNCVTYSGVMNVQRVKQVQGREGQREGGSDPYPSHWLVCDVSSGKEWEAR